MVLVTQDSENSVRFFDPPLWRQRREHIYEILKEHKARSVIDYGCGEGSVISLLVSCNDEPPIVKLAGLDISSEAVQESSNRCKPWQTDYDNLRERPLNVKIFQGSVAQPSSQLLGYEVLVSSEVIEHLFPEALERFPHVIFGAYHPPLVIISTPNAEFNVLFPQLNYLKPEAKFRDDDHKFEWTRSEFQTWCQSNSKLYGYSVEYSGVGLTPKVEDRHLGFCTQFAVFKKIEELVYEGEYFDHKLIANYDFPYFEQEVTDSDRAQCLIDSAKYISSVNSFGPQEWPVFNLTDFWRVLAVRQRFRNLEFLIDFINNPSRNENTLSLLSQECFVIHRQLCELKKLEEDNWPAC